MTALDVLETAEQPPATATEHDDDKTTEVCSTPSAAAVSPPPSDQSPAAKISSKKYHLIHRYHQDQQKHTGAHLLSSPAILLSTSTSTPPHSPLPLPPTTKSLMIIDSSSSVNEPDGGSRRQVTTPATAASTSADAIRIDVSDETTAGHNIHKEAHDDEAELPIIQTPPQSTASSVSLNDLSSSSYSSAATVAAVANAVIKEPAPTPVEQVVVVVETKRQRIETLKAQVRSSHEALKSTFKSSYTRLRQQQTKHIQVYIREQLRKLLDLAKTTPAAAATTPVDGGGGQVDLDKNGDLDILTSILKSNLDGEQSSDGVQELATVKQVANSVVKSLVDDLKYEITKRAEDRQQRQRQRRRPPRGHSPAPSTSESEDESEDDLSVETLRPLSFTGAETSPAAAIDKASSKYWTTSRVQLGSEWDRVQAKLKLLNERRRECNDYTAKQDRLMARYETAAAKAVSDEDEEAIAALEESLQECVTTTTTPAASDQLTPPQVSSSSSSRCEQRASLKSRLFNLSKNDLVSFDDEMLKSIYYTFIYFNKNLFKTTCWCNQPAAAPESPKKPRTTATASAGLSKTCIFCHLLRKYESGQVRSRDHTWRQQQQVPAVLRDQSNNMSVYKEWADVAHINNDHSYCKTGANGLLTCSSDQVKQRLTTPAAESPPHLQSPAKQDPPAKKRKLLFDDDGSEASGGDGESLIDQVVNERLNRLFGDHTSGKQAAFGCAAGKRSTLFDHADDKFYDLRLGQQRLDHDQLCVVDAGMEIDPKEIIQIPDLTYEELEFLYNEDEESEDQSCAESRHRCSTMETSDKENSDNSGGNGGRRPRQGASSKKKSCYFVSLLRKNRLLRYQLYQHQLQYRKNESELAQLGAKKKRRTKDNTPVAAPAPVAVPDRFNIASLQPHVVVRRLSHLNLKRLNKTTAHLHHHLLGAKNTTTRKRSNSSTSSSFSAAEMTADSPSPAPAPAPVFSSSSSQYVYLNNNQFDKFDIDNIVIPSEMISNCKVLNVAKLQDLPTPKWRELVIQPSADDAGEGEGETEGECLDDSAYLRRHEFYELKKRFEFVHKRVEKEKKSRLSRHHAVTPPPAHLEETSPATTADLSSEHSLTLGEEIIKRTHTVDDHTLDEFRAIVLALEREHQQHHHQQQQRTRRSRQSMSSEPSDQDSQDNTVAVAQQHHAAAAPAELDEWPRRRFPLSDHEHEQLEAENARRAKQDQLGYLSYLKLCKLTHRAAHSQAPSPHHQPFASPTPPPHKHGVYPETPPSRRQSHHQIYLEGPQANFTGIILLES